KAAQESHEEIHSILSTQTKMIFITAGMGGGTGTGAAPIIAQMAKSMDILTVGIVTMPFQFEGKLRLEQAQRGLEKIKGAVDALIVINNNKLREVYGNLGFKAGFAKADEVLATAARGIAEVITHHYTQNIDLKDAKTVLTNSGTAIMGSGTASGSNRAQEAIVKALDSPLLNDNKITGCKNVLLLIVSGSEEITIDEIGEISDYIQTEAGNHTNIIMGVGEDETLGNEVSVTVIATGFGQEQQNEISNTEAKKIIHSLEDDQKVVHDLSDTEKQEDQIHFQEPASEVDRTQFEQFTSENKNPLIEMNELLQEIEVDFEVVSYPAADPVQNAFETPEVLESNTIKQESAVQDEVTVHELNTEEIPVQTFPAEEIEPEMETTSDEIEMLSESPQEEKTQTQPLDFDLTSSFFESEEEVVEEKVELETLKNEKEDLTEVLAQESEFVFNEVEVKDPFEMKVVDPETIDFQSQMQMEFEIPLKPKGETEQISSLDDEVQQDIYQDKTIKDFDEAALEIKFELKDTEEQEVSQVEHEIPFKMESETTEQSKAEEDPFNQSIDDLKRKRFQL
ncbi:cell division FtsZ family protein, partial [Flavobacteriaceae bacterium]|nr:cell division FtsZ family protein [Flavobacteriaceae bacterium]